MKKIIIILGSITILILAGLAAWYFLGQKKPQKYTGPVEKIVIGNLGEYSIFNLIAQNKGYFKENGLDAEIKDYQAGTLEIKDLLGGSLNVATAGEFPAVISMFANNNLRILAEASKLQSTRVVARKDSGISNPYDLKGKKIGVTKNTAGELFLGRFLLFNNLTFSDVTIINLLPLELVDQITAGKIDAVVTWEPYPFQIENKLGDNAISWSAQGDQNTYVLFYSTDEFTKSHPQIIERYLQSLMQAETFVKDHNAEARDLVKKILGYDDAYMNYYTWKISNSLALGQALLLTMEDEARFAIANKLTDQTRVPNYLNFIYFDALTKIKPEAVTIIH